MRHVRLLRAVLCCALPLLATLAVAQPAAPRNRALLIGVTEYASEDFRDLRFAAKDATDFAAALGDSDVGGWAPGDVVVLTDAQVKAADVKEALVRMLKASQAGDFILLFFSGHGFVHDGNTFLAMTDTQVERAETTGLNLAELQQWLGLYGASSSKLLILDACHSGAALQASKGTKGVDYADLRSSLENLGGDTGYITSSGAGQTSQEDETSRNGAFTGLFLRALRGSARNGNGTVTYSDAFSYVRRNIKGQTPQQGGSLPTDIVLSRKSGVTLPDVIVDVVPTTRVGGLKITCDVAGAVIKLDGKTMATTTGASDIRLAGVPVGRHDIEVVADGYATWSSPVTVSAGVEAVLDAALISSPKRDRPPERAAAPTVAGLRPAGRNAREQDVFLRDKDGARVVKVPGGTFQMGSTEEDVDEAIAECRGFWGDKADEKCKPDYFRDETPQHAVTLGAYLLDELEVTWGRYRKYADATGAAMPAVPAWPQSVRDDSHPVVNVTWDEAAGYCAWVGAELPTEAQWEFAARGPRSLKYPWGSTWPPPRAGANVADEAARRVYPTWKVMSGHDDGYAQTSPAGALAAGAGPFGHLDLAGNVWEWVQDQYCPYTAAAVTDPKAATCVSERRVLRGGSFYAHSDVSRGASRYANVASVRAVNHGFRCAQEP